MTTKIILPEMGEGVIEGTIARWLKKEGEPVEKYEPLLEIETDKVTTEAEAEVSGVLQEIRVAEGETVPVGTVLGVIVSDSPPGIKESEPAKKTAAAAPEPEISLTAKREVEPTPAGILQNGKDGGYSRQTDVGWVSPVVARIAAEHDIDLSQIDGTGLKGRITKDDVLAFLENREEIMAKPATTSALQPAAASPPSVPVTPKGRMETLVEKIPEERPAPVPSLRREQTTSSGEVIPLTSMRRAIAEHMVASKRTSPHVTTVFEADFSAVVTHRQAHQAGFVERGVKLTFTPYMMLAIARALQDHPLANSSWEEEGIRLHTEINIGMATALNGGSGLIVPVVKGADGFNLLGMARAVNDLAERARANRLKPEEVRGGTFTLTNHGVSGSLLATPIINQPQSGILGVGAIQKRVTVVTDNYGQDSMAIRPMAYLSFTFDHRILDGVSADNFVARIIEILESWD